MTALLLEIKDLFCERDDRTLFENLSFKLFSGSVLQVKGKNGSGKTSLLRILCGLYQGYEGQVKFFGHDLADDRERLHQSLTFIGHKVSVKQALTARENLSWYANIQPQLDANLIHSALVAVGLDDYADVLCQNMSAGQKRRVNLARLFMLPDANFEHSLWVLDEPFTAIDVEGVAKLEQRILYYVENGGSVVLTTHQTLRIKTVELLNLDN